MSPLRPVRNSFQLLTASYSSHSSGIDIATGARPNRVSDNLDIEAHGDLSEFDISSSESDASSDWGLSGDGDDGDAIGSTSEIQELLSAINVGLESLFKASIFTRSFAPSDRRQRAVAIKSSDNHADAMYASYRYPRLKRNEALATRLDKANARRRQYFIDRRDYNDQSASAGQKRPIQFVESEATPFVPNESADVQIFDVKDGKSSTSMASLSTPAIVASSDELPFPPMPDEAQENSPFLCPYCFRVVHLEHDGNLEYQWRFELTVNMLDNR